MECYTSFLILSYYFFPKPNFGCQTARNSSWRKRRFQSEQICWLWLCDPIWWELRREEIHTDRLLFKLSKLFSRSWITWATHPFFHCPAYARLRKELLHSNKINSKEDLIKLSDCNLANKFSEFCEQAIKQKLKSQSTRFIRT